MSSITLTQEEIQAVIKVIETAMEYKDEETVKGMDAMIALLNQGLHQQDDVVEFQLDDDFRKYAVETIFTCLYEGAYSSASSPLLKSVDDKVNDADGMERGKISY